MRQTGKPGRPREWVLNEEIVEIHGMLSELKMGNRSAHWSAIQEMLKTQLQRNTRKDLLSKLEKLCGLAKQVIPIPPRCICGNRIYSYTYSKAERENGHYWEIFARCVNPNCRYMRRYLPSASYGWSRPASAARDFERIPTFYELDGQKVEGDKR